MVWQPCWFACSSVSQRGLIHAERHVSCFPPALRLVAASVPAPLSVSILSGRAARQELWRTRGPRPPCRLLLGLLTVRGLSPPGRIDCVNSACLLFVFLTLSDLLLPLSPRLLCSVLSPYPLQCVFLCLCVGVHMPIRHLLRNP